MISGVTRYTLGDKDTAAINDVYNKAKSIYANPDTPPSSGVIVNTVDEIWADMTEAPTGYPVASSLSYAQVDGPVFNGSLHTYITDWEKTTTWFEVEEASFGECPDWVPDSQSCAAEAGCGFTISESINTRVELTPMYQAIRNGATWTLTFDGSGTMGGSTHPTENMLFTGNRGCDVDAIEQIRLANLGYDVHVGATGINQLYYPKFYFREHGWGNGSPVTDPATITAVYVGQYARLILIDPNGVDDRHLARFVIHISSDMKAIDGSQIPGYEGWGIGGVSRFKMIPTNGDWMPINFVEGWITETDLYSNPPPFPKSPAPI